jgi:hypothetical protein
MNRDLEEPIFLLDAWICTGYQGIRVSIKVPEHENTGFRQTKIQQRHSTRFPESDPEMMRCIVVFCEMIIAFFR